MEDKHIDEIIKGEVEPINYQKKLVNPGMDCPLSETFSEDQMEKRIAFYRDLNEMRETLEREDKLIQRKFILYGWQDTSTVKVFLRETISRICEELFYSNYELSLDNINAKNEDGSKDKDHGHVILTVKATNPEIKALLGYIKPGSSFYVYNGEESKYVKGDTDATELIITRAEDKLQPQKFWRRSQSYIYRVERLE
ncbi:hypothetical protein ACFLZX_05460 [Nanoarchaeota archaeon]